MMIYMMYFRCAVIMTMIFACNIADAAIFEFGGALKQELKLVKTSDSDVVAVVKVSIENSIMLTFITFAIYCDFNC